MVTKRIDTCRNLINVFCDEKDVKSRWKTLCSEGGFHLFFMFSTGSGLMLLKYHIEFAVYWENCFKLGPTSLILAGDRQQKCPVDLSRLRSHSKHIPNSHCSWSSSLTSKGSPDFAILQAQYLTPNSNFSP